MDSVKTTNERRLGPGEWIAVKSKGESDPVRIGRHAAGSRSQSWQWVRLTAAHAAAHTAQSGLAIYLNCIVPLHNICMCCYRIVFAMHPEVVQ